MFVGRIDLFLPGGLHGLAVHEVIDRLVDGCRGDDLLERCFTTLLVTAGDQLADLGLLQRAVRVQQQGHHRGIALPPSCNQDGDPHPDHHTNYI